MAATGDVKIAQNGTPAKLHPYIIALVRWCVSCFWSTATVFLHRLIAAPITPIAGLPSTKQQKRPASKDHLDPEPKVECVVLHQPEVHNLDVIFVHGLYGSLSNTWRQGEWSSKYINGPETVPLRRSNSKPTPYVCDKCTYIDRNNQLTSDNHSTSDNRKAFNESNNHSDNNNDTENITVNNDTSRSDDKGFDKNDDEYDMKNDNRRIFEDIDDDRNLFDYDSDNDFTNIGEKFYKNIEKILPRNDVFVTEKFYNNTLLNQVEIMSNYDTQAEFVHDLFKNSCENDIRFNIDREGHITSIESNSHENAFDDDNSNNNNHVKRTKHCDVSNILCKCKCKVHESEKFKQAEIQDRIDNCEIHSKDLANHENQCNCNFKENETEVDSQSKSNKANQPEFDCKCRTNEGRQCEVGCGCICDECYSSCWPRDWIKEDYPDARVISINYTSDPYLWRPLWVKETKRLRLHERADQMTEQLLELGVGEKPVIWVGHSKGGLFIKQIYCDAYEAHLKIKNAEENQPPEDQNLTEFIKDNEINENYDNVTINININDITNNNIRNDSFNDSNSTENNPISKDIDAVDNYLNINFEIRNKNQENDENNQSKAEIRINESINKDEIDNETVSNVKLNENDKNTLKVELKLSSNDDDDSKLLNRRSKLWSNSVGFMLYSVPHRGSPLADIKTPLTARSVELLEITKDCSLVLSLQERWERASSGPQPLVRSLVETRRTLMSVLWLTIVSYDSADPGTGALCGVSVDHREICKPSSRHCLLYQELVTLIRAALNRCSCDEGKRHEKET